MSRFYASLAAGNIGLMIALDCGLPLWRDYPIGDATDFGVSAFILVWATITALRRTA